MDTSYSGEEKLALGLYIGVRHTSATVTHLVPGAPPKIRRVSRWPHRMNSTKIPSAIFYSRDGIPQSFGAATGEETDEAEAQDWILCRRFALRLYAPLGMDLSVLYEVAPLPEGVTLNQVYTDWMGYLYRSIKDWWTETTPDGAHIWNQLENKIVFCIAQPDRQSRRERKLIRRSLARATHSPDLARGAQSDRVVFVSESMAKFGFSVHFAPKASLCDWLWDGAQLAVVDAGDSTITTSLFKIGRDFMISQLESTTSVHDETIYDGRAMMTLMKEQLGGSRYDNQETLNAFVETVDSMLDPEAGPRQARLSRQGRLSLSWTEVARVYRQAFTPPRDVTCESVALQIRNTNVKTIMLCGTFEKLAALQDSLIRNIPDMKVITSDELPYQAVADGIVMSYLGPSTEVLDALQQSGRNLIGEACSAVPGAPETTLTSKPRETHQI